MKVRVKFIDVLSVLVRWKKFVILNFFMVCLITAAISLIIPKWYRSQATILPPTDDGGLNFGAILNNLPLAGLGLGGGFDEGTSMIVAIVNSRSLKEKIISEFDLVSRYKVENVEEALEILRSRIAIDISDEGMIKIDAMTKTSFLANSDQELKVRRLSQSMTSFIVDQVDNRNRQLKTEQARRNRVFIEKRYFQNVADLKAAEDSLQIFQQKNGILVLPEQLQASISAMAEIKAQIAMTEMDLEYKRLYMGATHPDYMQAQNRLKAMITEYDSMLSGDKNRDNVIIPLDKAPEMGIKFARLYREVKLQEAITEFLLPQYEQAKIQEAKDTSTIQVLDAPFLPIKRIKPKRALLVLLAGFAGLLISILAAYIHLHLTYMEENNAQEFKKITQILHELNPRYFFK